MKVLDLAVEMEAAKMGSGGIDPELQQRTISAVGRVMALKPEELKRVIAETLLHSGLSGNLRQEVLQSFLIQLGVTNPQDALSVWTTEKEKFPAAQPTRSMVSKILKSWSGQDPQAAMEWARGQMGDYPDVINEEVRLGIVNATAANDPVMALKFTDELAISDRLKAVEGIASAAKSAGARTTALNALREYAEGLESSEEGGKIMAAALPKLVEQAGREGFAACSAWLESADLTEPELARCVSSVPSGNDAGKWLEWIGGHLASAESDAAVRNRMERWTAGDHRAAGNWLNTAPDGPVRQAAISAFAETVAQYEPESAEKWALTLPEGPERTVTLQKILTKWPTPDAAGKESAAAFARRYGLE